MSLWLLSAVVISKTLKENIAARLVDLLECPIRESFTIEGNLGVLIISQSRPRAVFLSFT